MLKVNDTKGNKRKKVWCLLLPTYFIITRMFIYGDDLENYNSTKLERDDVYLALFDRDFNTCEDPRR